VKIAYLSLGSNLGHRERLLEAALRGLNAPDLRILRVSPVYETEPADLPNQPWFLNLVAEAETTLFPRQLLARALKVERKLGRRRDTPKGPRTIDIDILFYGGFVLDTPELTLPHPRFAARRFVLAPLVDLAPGFRDPVSRHTMAELLVAAPRQAVRRVEFVPEVPAAKE